MSTSRVRRRRARTLATHHLAVLVGGAVTAACLQFAAAADPKGKEKCYGIAKAGENGCASVNGVHTCSGLARVNYSGQEWKLVSAGTCEKLGGKRAPYSDAPNPADAHKAK